MAGVRFLINTNRQISSIGEQSQTTFCTCGLVGKGQIGKRKDRRHVWLKGLIFLYVFRTVSSRHNSRASTRSEYVDRKLDYIVGVKLTLRILPVADLYSDGYQSGECRYLRGTDEEILPVLKMQSSGRGDSP